MEMAAVSAALHFCFDAKAKHRVMELCGIASGAQTVLASEKRGIQNMKKTEKNDQSCSKGQDELKRRLHQG